LKILASTQTFSFGRLMRRYFRHGREYFKPPFNAAPHIMSVFFKFIIYDKLGCLA